MRELVKEEWGVRRNTESDCWRLLSLLDYTAVTIYIYEGGIRRKGSIRLKLNPHSNPKPRMMRPTRPFVLLHNKSKRDNIYIWYFFYSCYDATQRKRSTFRSKLKVLCRFSLRETNLRLLRRGHQFRAGIRRSYMRCLIHSNSPFSL